MSFLQDGPSREPFWAWVVAFNPGRWELVTGAK